MWRRVYSYTASVLILALLAWIVFQIDSDAELTRIAFWLIILLWCFSTYYMVAPTAEQITRIIKAAKLNINIDLDDEKKND